LAPNPLGATEDEPNPDGTTIKIYALRRPDKTVRGWEVGRRNVKKKRISGELVGAWDDALKLRAKLERAAEYHQFELEHTAAQRAAARNEVTELLLLALDSLIDAQASGHHCGRSRSATTMAPSLLVSVCKPLQAAQRMPKEST
jgi:hypothetical protein